MTWRGPSCTQGWEDTFKFLRAGAFPNTMCWNWAQFGPGVDTAPPVCHPGGSRTAHMLRMGRAWQSWCC